jgi:phosphoglycerate dehydrogenase-like enzyme
MRAVLYAPPQSRPFLLSRLSEIAGLDLVNATSLEDATAGLDGADAIILPQSHLVGPLAASIAAAPDLKWVQLLNAGYERVRKEMLPPGVVLTNAGEGLAPAVAEQALALLLALARRIPASLKSQSEGIWEKGARQGMLTLRGRTVAVVGLGPIGREVARLLAAFGADVVGLSRHGLPQPGIAEVRTIDQLADVVGRSDAAVSVLPHNPGTEGLFDAALFARCRPGLLLVNVGRGSAIVTADLLAALESGQISGAGLDVTDPEPLPPGHPLWSARNVIVTPHVAGGDGSRGVAELVGRNVERFIAGEQPLSPIVL